MANRRYQCTFKGQLKRAERSQRYRDRKRGYRNRQRVTNLGSLSDGRRDAVDSSATDAVAETSSNGYRGSPDHFRHFVALHRPRPAAVANLRLTTMKAEMGQVDWGHFGHLQIGRARRSLMAFVMVLSWSRQVFLQFFLDARMESFLRGHIAAFQAWSGLPHDA